MRQPSDQSEDPPTRRDGRCCSSTRYPVTARRHARRLPIERESGGSRSSSSARIEDTAPLVREAVARGADALAVAGGDGSLAVVAAAASTHGLPFTCVPAGTRNHFARDLGIHRHDLTDALDALIDGVERRIDVAEVNGRTFLNNVSLGIYGDAVRRTQYRGAKVRTLLETADEVLGPSAEVPELRLVDDLRPRAHPSHRRAGLEQPVRAGSAGCARNASDARRRPSRGHRPRWTAAWAPSSWTGVEYAASGSGCPEGIACRNRWRGDRPDPAPGVRDPAGGAARRGSFRTFKASPVGACAASGSGHRLRRSRARSGEVAPSVRRQRRVQVPALTRS